MNEKKKAGGFLDFKDVDMIIFIPTLLVFLSFVIWGLIDGASMNRIMSGFLGFFTNWAV